MTSHAEPVRSYPGKSGLRRTDLRRWQGGDRKFRPGVRPGDNRYLHAGNRRDRGHPADSAGEPHGADYRDVRAPTVQSFLSMADYYTADLTLQKPLDAGQLIAAVEKSPGGMRGALSLPPLARSCNRLAVKGYQAKTFMTLSKTSSIVPVPAISLTIPCGR